MKSMDVVDTLAAQMTSRAAIRRGHDVDLSAVAQFLKISGLPTSDLTNAHEFHFWVVEEKGSLIGAIALERFGHEALLRSLTVAPEHRKRGLGHKLVARLERDVQAAGIRELILLTETAQPFFQRLGYLATDRGRVSDKVKQSAEFRSLCPVSAICMCKTLNHD